MPHWNLGDFSVVVFTIYDSIRCETRKVGYPGSDLGESGVKRKKMRG
jgi:hypothetical protein